VRGPPAIFEFVIGFFMQNDGEFAILFLPHIALRHGF